LKLIKNLWLKQKSQKGGFKMDFWAGLWFILFGIYIDYQFIIYLYLLEEGMI